MGYGQANIPAQLGKLLERFERWRRTHAVRSRLPDELWVAAVQMVGRYGLSRTVKTLKLDYYALKKRVENSPKKQGERRVARTSDSKKRGERQAACAVDRAKASVLKLVDLQKSGGVRFVELANSPGRGVSAGGCECCVEWEDAAGSKMRVHLRGTAMPDLAALSRSFWNPANKESAS